MASRKLRHKRVISKDTEDESQPPVKRKKSVPEDQLKLERVLKAASTDASVLDNAKSKNKDRGTAPKQQPNNKTSTKMVESSQVESKKIPEVQKTKSELKRHEKESKPISQKVKEKRIESPRAHSQKTHSRNPKESEYFKKEKPASRTATQVPKTQDVKRQEKKAAIDRTKKAKPDSGGNGLSKAPTKPVPKKNLETAPIKASPKMKQQQPKREGNQGATLNKKSPSIKQEHIKNEKPLKKVTAKPDIKRKKPSDNKTLTDKKESPKKEPTHLSPHWPSKEQMVQEEDDSDSDESDWEEVEENASPEKSQLPSEPVTITLKGPDLMHKKRKKGSFDVEAFIRRRINRAEQELQLHMHKVHLLCLLSHGFHRNRLCKDDDLLSVGLSVVPARFFEREYIFWDGNYLEKLVKWFHSTFTIAHDISENNTYLKATLLNRLATREAASEAELVFLLLIILRGMGCQVRLMTSLQPVSHKCATKLKVKRVKPVEEESPVTVEPPRTEPPRTEPPRTEPPEKKLDTTVMDLIKAAEAKHRSPQNPAKKTATPKPKAEKTCKETPKQKTKSLKRRTCASKVTYNDSDGDDDIQCLTPGKSKTSRKRTSTSDKDSTSTIEVLSSDGDFEEVPTKLRKSPSVTGRKKTSNKKVLSSDSDSVEVTKVVKTEKGTDYWLEVYLERAENWIPVDCVTCRTNNAGGIESRATQPVYYVLGYDNDNCIKDVTPRYSSGWQSTVRKLRRDEGWWEEVLEPFRARNKARDEAEDMRMHTQQMKKPLPTSISEFKNHPLYALKRHLLKFEAIYPADATPVGYIRGEPVYARECVQDLHTRETWLKEGRAVRVKEKPYKLVKARKKRSKKSFETAGPSVEEPQSECFGRWQTEQYMPPPAYNGKVPRNEYGNVEVFKPWMIPAGAVHLQIPGLNKVARKLNIDCAPAMVGWDFHSGYTHPVLDGFIVCEEHKDLLLAAWDEQQEIEKEKEAEKREIRVLANWKKMVKNLIIRERMKKRFNLQEAKLDAKGASKVEEKAKDVQLAWPANRPDVVNKLSTADQTNLFPSEEL